MRLVAAIAVAATLATAGAASAGGQKSDSYVVHFSPLNIVDTGKKGMTAGDLIVSSDLLLRNGKQVGRAALTCTITNPKVPEGACAITWALPGGTVSGQFLNSPPARKLVAITGGTGAYVGARGQALLVESGKNQTGSLAFTFLP
jgi:hypothetical protein